MCKEPKNDDVFSSDEEEDDTSGESSMTPDSLENLPTVPVSSANTALCISGTQANANSTMNIFSTGTNVEDNFQESTIGTSNNMNTNMPSSSNEARNIVNTNNYFAKGTLNVEGQYYPVVVFNLETPQRLVAFGDRDQWPNYESGSSAVTHTDQSIYMDSIWHVEDASVMNNENQISEPENVGELMTGLNSSELVEIVPTLCEQYMNEITDHTLEEINPSSFYPEPTLEMGYIDDISVGRETEIIMGTVGACGLQEQVLPLAVSKRKIEHKEEHKPKKPKLEGTGDDMDDSSGSN